MHPVEQRNHLLGPSVVAALRKRHFDAHYFDSAALAADAALHMIPAGSSVTWGGSMTIRQIGLCDALKAAPLSVFDRDTCPPEERAAFLQAHYFSDFFLASVNALTEDGILLNMDRNGNRVASMIFGPKRVLLLVGINKVVRDIDAGIARIRGTAAPINAQRFEGNTPCRRTGTCSECLSPDSICASFTAMRLCRPAGRISVLLFGEPAGF